MLGERLADRHQELQGMMGRIQTFTQDLNDVLTWIELKDLDVQLETALPVSEREAKKKLKEHEEFHKELLDKQAVVDDIRSKAQELLKAKKGVPGIEAVQHQLTQLGN